ncbi:DUF3021 domain-containing protein [Paenibacillus sp. 1011MAR3C5]|uniref:DUF3021 domain-containing protein n=1 Tax=Paenibacillus sp. 1011MAR3C5 TaxID=1675787 RepID=UPI0016019F52|nr:DUF3021 domain-containing protein [Paenibacillus sp. 1011MAR3C5]
MVSEVFKRIMLGFGCSAIIMLAVLTGLMMKDAVVPAKLLWGNLLASMIMGAYFGAASFIFQYDRWSPLKQLMVHFLLSIALYFPISIGVGWIPLKPLAIVLGLIMFIVTYSIFWTGFRYYFKKQAEALNASVRKGR